MSKTILSTKQRSLEELEEGLQRHILQEVDRIRDKRVLSDHDVAFMEKVYAGAILPYISWWDHRRQEWDYRMRPSRSFVIGFMGPLSGQFENSAGTTATYKNTSGVSHSANAGALSTVAGGGTVLTGIVVGIGQTAPAPADYALQTPIANGSGSGQLVYGAEATTEGNISGGNVQESETRLLTNSYTGSITVYEMALYCVQSAAYYMCLIHDSITVLFNTLDVKTATYTLKGTT